MINGRLDRRAVRRATQALVADSYQHVRVMRGRYGEEVRVGEFRARIAATSGATGSLDQQSVIGDSAPQMYVVSAPEGIGLRKGDELWSGEGQRYRIVMIDATPGARQIIAESIQ